jgi:hypothetical protein
MSGLLSTVMICDLNHIQGYHSPFLSSFDQRDQIKAAKMRFFHENSDLLTWARVVEEWNEVSVKWWAYDLSGTPR